MLAFNSVIPASQSELTCLPLLSSFLNADKTIALLATSFHSGLFLRLFFGREELSTDYKAVCPTAVRTSDLTVLCPEAGWHYQIYGGCKFSETSVTLC
jgi:hypothetical protein